VAQAAEDAGVAPQAWVDDIAARFTAAWTELAISHDDFIRTTEPRHRRTVQELFRRIQEHGHIYEGVYTGWYCVGCEAFKLDKDLDDQGRCPTHPTREIKWVEEPNFFFRLSAFAPWLLERYAADPTFVRPKPKMNEIRNVVADGLQDISVSRARVPWGIPWPGDETHTVYVWFEALINYLSATGFPDDGYADLWPADLHVIGPDIVRFHAAMWPAMLHAAGVEPPRGVWAHGWINTQGERFSKSAGVRVGLREIIDRYGPDPLRYFLLREVPWDGDGNFSFERFDARYTSDLADGYGNLVSRVLAMLVRYLDATVPARDAPTSLDETRDAAWTRYTDRMDQHLLHEGAATAMSLVAEANGFIEARAPWTLAKQGDRDGLAVTLGALADTVQTLTVMLAPFLPAKTRVVWRALGNSGNVTPVTGRPPSAEGQHVQRITPLFPKPGAPA